jgi:hypothetical protein
MIIEHFQYFEDFRIVLVPILQVSQIVVQEVQALNRLFVIFRCDFYLVDYKIK